MTYVIAYDVGTTGVKTCLFSVDRTISLLKSAQQGYGLTILPDGGVSRMPRRGGPPWPPPPARF